MKKIFTCSLIAILAAVTAFFAVSCGKKDNTTIAVDSESKFKIEYFVGDELNLTGARLVVKKGEEIKYVDLTDESVTVSGYDKTKLGTQTLTVTYEKKTTTFTVTVKERPEVSVKGYKKDYFVGSAFSDAGKLYYTDSDGRERIVGISASGVTVTGFDSATAGEKTLKIVYEKGANSYETEIKINVYAIESVNVLRSPNKTSYKTYENEIRATGGEIQYVGNGGQLLSDAIEMTPDMLKGYDPSVVTEENTVTNAYRQTIKVVIDGKEYGSFDIKIIYSGVTYIEKVTPELQGFDFTDKENFGLTEAQGEKALKGVKYYGELNASEKARVTDEQKSLLFGAAATYGLKEWKKASAPFGDVLVFEGADMTLTGGSYADTRAAVDKFRQSTRFVELCDLLSKIRDESDKIELDSTTTIAAYLEKVPTVDDVNANVAALDYMFELYTALEPVPEEWTAETLDNYKTNVEQVVSIISSGEYYGNANLRFIYALINEWRTKQDYFEILYTYYYNIHLKGLAETEEDKKQAYELTVKNAVKVLGTVHLTNKLEDIYDTVSSAIAAYDAYQIDSSVFVYNFALALSNITQLAQSEDEMNKYFYGMFTFSEFLIDADKKPIPVTFAQLVEYVRNNMFIPLDYAMYGDAVYTDLLNAYIKVFEPYVECEDENAFFTSDEFKTNMAALLEGINGAAPRIQLGFLMSLSKGYPVLAFDKNAEQGLFYNYLGLFTDKYFESVLDESSRIPATKLMNALATLVCRFAYKDDEIEFKALMQDIIDNYTALSETAKTTFDTVLGGIYNNCLDAYNYTETAVADEWKTKFDELVSAIDRCTKAFTRVQKGETCYALVVISYERAKSIADDILTNAPDAVKLAYYRNLTVNNEQPLWYAMYRAETYFKYLQTELRFGDTMLWNFYFNEEAVGLAAFVNKAYDVIYAADKLQNGVYTEEYKTTVLGIMNDYRALDLYSKVIFKAIDVNGDYYTALDEFFATFIESGALKSAITLMFEIEKNGVYYQSVAETGDFKEELEGLKKAIDSFKIVYDKLEEQDKTTFNAYFKDMYDYYCNVYAEATKPATGETVTE